MEFKWLSEGEERRELNVVVDEMDSHKLLNGKLFVNIEFVAQ
jgi:hypothetical protein